MEYLSKEDRGAVRLVRIANPPRGYMNAAMAEELDAAFAEAESEDGVRALIFAGGVPGVFIRHYDVAEIVEVAEAMRSGAASAEGDRAASPVYRLIDRLSASELPTIAAIGGVCMGGGCEFALACDIAWRQRAIIRSACRRRGSASFRVSADCRCSPGLSVSPARRRW